MNGQATATFLSGIPWYAEQCSVNAVNFLNVLFSVSWACFGLIIIATYTANLSAKLAVGLKDNRLSSIWQLEKYAEENQVKILTYLVTTEFTKSVKFMLSRFHNSWSQVQSCANSYNT